MDILSWLSTLNILVLVFSIYQISTILTNKRTVYTVLISLALIFYLTANIVFLIDRDLKFVIRFINLTSLICVLSALFSLIRESKPIFARFPTVLSYLPFVTLLFIPLILDQTVIYNLLAATFQGGSILVALMIFGLNHLNNKRYKLHISGSALLLIAFVLFWFNPLAPLQEIVISELLIISGILFVTTGTKKFHIHTQHVKFT